MSSISESKRISAEEKDVMCDLETIETWYNHCYNKTVSDQHNCTLVELNENYTCYPVFKAHPIFDKIVRVTGTIPNISIVENRNIAYLPPEFMAALAQIDQDQVESVAKSHSPQMENWYKKGDLSSLQRAVVKLVEKVDSEVGFASDQKSSNQRLLTKRMFYRGISDSTPGILAPAVAGTTSYALGTLGFSSEAAAISVVLGAGLAAYASHVAKGVANEAIDRKYSQATKRSIVKNKIIQYAKDVRPKAT